MNRTLHFGSMLIAFLAVSMSVWAQGDVLWKRHLGEQGVYRSVTAVSDGMVAVGNVGSIGYNGGTATIVKCDNNGNVVWKKNFGNDSDNVYNSVTTVSDGIVVAGYGKSFGSGDWEGVAGKGGDDAIIIKYNNNGEIVWKKNFGCSSQDWFTSVTTVSDGIIAVGHAVGFGDGDWEGIAGKGNTDAIIVKYTNNGDIVWKKNFGGIGLDFYESIAVVSDGIVAVGRSSGPNTGVFPNSFGTGDWVGVTGNGRNDAIIVKYNSNGDIVWKKNFGGSGSDYYNSVTAVSDGIVAVGYSAEISFGNGDWIGVTGKGDDDAIIVKYNNNGDVVWKKHFGGNASDAYNSVTAMSDGIVAVGYSAYYSFDNGDWSGVTAKGNADATIVKYDNNGSQVWKRSFGDLLTDRFNSVMTVSDGIIAAGYSYLNPIGSMNTGDWAGISGNGSEAIIVKYSTNPTSITDNSQDATLRVYPNPTNGQLYITGFDGTDAMNGVCTDVQIFDVYGRKVLVAPVETGRAPSLQQQHPITTLNISHLPEGVYFLRIGDKTKKIVKIDNNSR